MIAITQKEKEIIAHEFPRVHIVRTMKSDSGRHHYFMEEAGGAMRRIRALRGQDVSSRKAV